MSKATAAAPPSTANEVPIDRPPRRQSPPTFDCRAATIKPQTTPLRDNHAPSIMPPPRRRIPILIVAAFSSRSPRDIQTVREKFTCRECEKITQPPAPFHTIPRGWAGPSLLAMILFEKFGQHQPLNR